MARITGQTVVPRDWRCVECVVRAVEAWAGVTVGDLNAQLGRLYLVHHARCDRGALRLLVEGLRAAACGSTSRLQGIACSWTVSRVVRQVCGV